METQIIDDFKEALMNEDKYKCIEIILKELSNGIASIVDIYSHILTPSLNEIGCLLKDKNICIWNEHVRTSIVRSVIENVYPYLVKEKIKNKVRPKNKKIFVVCPDGEQHEIGARMAADYFELNGYESIFVGSSTPVFEFKNVIETIKPEYIALSVTNFYNIVSAKKTIELIKSETTYDVGIIVGGNAFLNNKDLYTEIGADYCMQTFEDIKDFAKEVE